MHRRRVYIDTSVLGGCCDEEFAPESRALIEMAVRGEIVLLLSDLLFQELEGAPADVLAVVRRLPEDSFLPVTATTESEDLRDSYMAAQVVGPSSEDDALHVAIATVSNADLIVSWNFKHIVHVDKIRRFNAVNLVQGYQAIDIRSPKEVVVL